MNRFTQELSSDEAFRLLKEAASVAPLAYAPYSGLQVGAALLDCQGRTFTGCNVENASYGLSICAEQAAVCRAIAAGSRQWRAVAVRALRTAAGAWVDPFIPCGACRQILAEFNPGLAVVTAGPEGEPLIQRLEKLLSSPFRLE